MIAACLAKDKASNHFRAATAAAVSVFYSATTDTVTCLRRLFANDVFHCERCAGRRRFLSMITESTTAQKILNHLGWQSPARTPPPIDRVR